MEIVPTTVEDPAALYAPSHYRIKLSTIESLIELWLAITNGLTSRNASLIERQRVGALKTGDKAKRKIRNEALRLSETGSWLSKTK